MPPGETYRAHPRYWIYVLVAALMVALMSWDLGRELEVGSVVFLGISLGLLIWYGRALGSRVVLEGHQITVYRPLAAPQTVEFRQLAGAGAEGRMGQAILLLYHPTRDHGLLDFDELQSLALPAVEDQDRLLAVLMEKVPK